MYHIIKLKKIEKATIPLLPKPMSKPNLLLQPLINTVLQHYLIQTILKMVKADIME